METAFFILSPLFTLFAFCSLLTLIVISSSTVAPASGMRNGPPWMPPSTARKGTILTPFVLQRIQEDIS